MLASEIRETGIAADPGRQVLWRFLEAIARWDLAAAETLTTDDLVMWWPQEQRLAISSRRMWEGSMLCRRFALGSYPSIARREDTQAVKDLRQRANRITYTDQPLGYCYVIHGSNTSGARHLTKLFTKATETVSAEDYAARLEQFATVFPMHAYREALARLGRGV